MDSTLTMFKSISFWIDAPMIHRASGLSGVVDGFVVPATEARPTLRKPLVAIGSTT